jgi:hypothetical protein
MSQPPNPKQSKRLARFALYAAVVAQLIPLCFAVYGIANPMFYWGPLFTEVRYSILVLGLIGVLFGSLALIKRTNSKVRAIAAIVMGLVAVTWHVLICGTDPFGSTVRFCPMMWGIRIY